MKLFYQLQPANLSSLLLYGTILLADIDYTSIADYIIKAILGGAIWLGFHLLQDHYSAKIKTRRRRILKPRNQNKDKGATI